jgi:signal peptidase II
VRGLQAARGATLTGSTSSTGSTASPPGRPDGEPGRPPTPRIAVLLGVAIGVLALDIASKAIVVATLSDRPPVRLLGGLLTLRESRNPGAAFSLGGSSETIVFTAIAVGVAIFIIRASRRIYSPAWAVALGLLLGGSTGNLTDRLFRAPGPFRGWVVDWIELPHWPVFNVADSAITCGGVLMVALAVFGHTIEGTARTADAPASPAPARPEGAQPPPAQPPPAQPEGTYPEEPAQAEGVPPPPGPEQPRHQNPTRHG